MCVCIFCVSLVVYNMQWISLSFDVPLELHLHSLCKRTRDKLVDSCVYHVCVSGWLSDNTHVLPITHAVYDVLTGEIVKRLKSKNCISSSCNYYYTQHTCVNYV